MRKLILLVNIFLSLNLSSQETVDFPDEIIPQFLNMHADLNEDPIIFPLINSDSLSTLTFNEIENYANEIKDSLELLFIEYYSKSKTDYDKVAFKDFFQVKSKINNIDSRIDYYHINWNVDSTKSQSILKNRPFFESGITFKNSKNNITISRNIKPKNDDSINKNGLLPIRLKYLVGFDTIKIFKEDVGKEFKFYDEEYKLVNILNGNIYLKVLDNSRGFKNLENSFYIAYKEKQMISTSRQYKNRSSFESRIKTSSKFLNDSLVLLNINLYKNYLKDLNFEKNKILNDLIILDAKVNFDEIHILIPKYDFLFKVLEAEIKKTNVDKIEIISTSMSISPDLKKDKPLKN